MLPVTLTLTLTVPVTLTVTGTSTLTVTVTETVTATPHGLGRWHCGAQGCWSATTDNADNTLVPEVVLERVRGGERVGFNKTS